MHMTERSEIGFYDANWKEVPKEQATAVIIRELDEAGNVVNVVTMFKSLPNV
ncbi:hypothetical protein [Paenibacillus sinopodophylli]|uniref:hypothetical protein n=1 Tax=Paenibacillus sinopodophylli TaxID=1837342 RepID=UPI00148637D9|nr:hypothetical protein [Paenibacillus sinopodophylli]